MIELVNLNQSEPYDFLKKYYDEAIAKNQKIIEAISISSLNKSSMEIESRFVNLKYVINDEWIFFSNYNSIKAQNFQSHDQISAVIFWNQTNVQIRMKAKIKKTSPEFSDKHFNGRTQEKNALAIASNQSMPIDSYEQIIEKHRSVLNENTELRRPDYWGGYSFTPYYFEFWEGNNSRINKRITYEFIKNLWKKSFLQP